MLELHVRLVTDDMLFNSVTVRLGEMTSQAFLSPHIFALFQDALAAVLSVHREQIIIFNVQVGGAEGGSDVRRWGQAFLLLPIDAFFCVI